MTEKQMLSRASAYTRSYMRRNNHTLRSLAEKAGTDHSTVRRLHDGESLPRTVTLARLAKAMETTPDSLLGLR